MPKSMMVPRGGLTEIRMFLGLRSPWMTPREAKELTVVMRDVAMAGVIEIGTASSTFLASGIYSMQKNDSSAHCSFDGVI